MSDEPSTRDPRESFSGWAIVAIAVALGFALFVIRRGFARHAVVTWMVASAIGIAFFLGAQAIRGRRAK